jgi:hypothetical protein
MKKLNFFFVIVLLTCNSVGAQSVPISSCCCRVSYDSVSPGWFFYHCWLQSSLLNCCPEYGFLFYNSKFYNAQGINTGIEVFYVSPELISANCPACNAPL